MRDNMQQLLRLLLGAGLILVEPVRRGKAADNIGDRVDNWTDTAKKSTPMSWIARNA
jgi:predicted aldo/keto reductase-like oxidoreductase